MRSQLESVVLGAALIGTCIASVLGCGGEGEADFDDADVTNPSVLDWDELLAEDPEGGPWARWWWPGGEVEDAELARQLQAIADNGFAGVELQIFDAALDPGADADELARRRSYGSVELAGHIDAALTAAAAVGLGVDVTLGSGWPMGGPHVQAADSMQTLLFSEAAVEGDQSVSLPLDGPAQPHFYSLAVALEATDEPLVRWLPEHARLVEVLAARVTDDGRTTDPLDLTDQVLLEPGSVVVLTDQVTSAEPDEGAPPALQWEVPAGTWQVIALWAAPDGQYVSLEANPRPDLDAGELASLVTNHLDTDAIARSVDQLLGPDSGLAGGSADAVRAIFIDSFELETEVHWTADALEQFEARRGYDVRPWLPALLVPGADNHILDGAGLTRVAAFQVGAEESDDARVRADWRLTISELFVERLAGGLTTAAAARGLQTRMQPYGANIDVIYAAGAVDIPEVEQLYAGGTDMLLKLVASGAALHGRPIVSAEAFSWSARDHAGLPLHFKAGADKLFAAGVNQIVAHGVPYRKLDGYGAAGWHAFSSPWTGVGTFGSNLGETSPFWETGALQLLNRYVARCQAILQTGEPALDVLVYYPWIGFPASFARAPEHDEPLFGGVLRAGDPGGGGSPLFGLIDILFGQPDLGPRGDWLAARWPRLEALADRGLTWGWINDERLLSLDTDTLVRGVVIAGVPSMPAEVAEHLADLAEAGLPVFIEGSAPARQRGWLDLAAGDAAVAAAMERIAAATAASDVMDLTPTVALEAPAGSARIAVRRLSADTATALAVFVHNRTAEAVEARLTMVDGCPDAVWFDPLTAGFAPATIDEGAVRVVLDPWGAGFVVCDSAPAEGVASGTIGVAALPTSATDVALAPWRLQIDDQTLDDHQLGDWRGVAELKYATGPGVYGSSFTAPAGGDRIVLDLGHVEGAAQVRLDGVLIAHLIAPPWRADLSSVVIDGVDHELSITVTVPQRNAYIGRALAGDPEVAQFDGRADALVPAGLLGPVRLAFSNP